MQDLKLSPGKSLPKLDEGIAVEIPFSEVQVENKIKYRISILSVKLFTKEEFITARVFDCLIYGEFSDKQILL